MLQIVYTSTANQEFSPADLEWLLTSARARNKVIGVTGMLVFHHGTFLQALEGEKRAVNEIFASIRGDGRHRDVTILHRGSGLEQRVFGHWSMGFADVGGAADLLRGFMQLNERLRIKDLDGPRAIELLAACGDEETLKAAGA
jgi:FAD-dependent sensor of blue light